MLDRTIPFFNTILKCSDYSPGCVKLPDGFSIVSYQSGYEKEWAKLEYDIGDFESLEAAERYFVENYLQNSEQLPNILFLLNREHEIVGSCIAWRDMHGEKSVSSLHWLVVQERYQGIGLGRALCMAVMNIYDRRGELPVYIHTQPWSWKAILLYHSLGFRLQKTDTFSHYENEYVKAMAELRKIVSEEQYDLLQQSSEE
ncbi:MAG: GNAT family N-acetyltransferase [Clostridiales bacterium]|nr:GNAT family N-acetyltransferase [Clostridiales bacterium]